LFFCCLVGERDERATPCDRYAPVADAACRVRRGGVLAARLAGEVVACIEDVEGSEPIRRGGCGFARVDGKGGVPRDDVTKEEQCDAKHGVQRGG
jgi:hypothetical protein